MARPDGPRPGPWDPGLQNERTALAWRRTVASAYGAHLVMGRLLLDRAPVLAVALAVSSTVLVAVLGILAGHRYRLSGARLHRGEDLPDAKLFLLATALTVVVGSTGLATVVLSH
jgi:uncharacterized membrane protein YidH (DUF202 family)